MKGMNFVWVLLMMCVTSNIHAQTLKFVGSTPSNESSVSDLTTITLDFDLSDVIAAHGGSEFDWGICSSSAPYIPVLPQMEQTATLYKGNQESGDVLERIAVSIRPSDDNFKVGNQYDISFSSFEIEEGQIYTLVVKYDFYAGRQGEETWTVDTKLSFKDNPLVLTFYGGNNSIKVLSLENVSIDQESLYETLPTIVGVSFNYDVDVLNDSFASVYEDENLITKSTTIERSSDNPKSIVISFPEETLYNGHKYDVVLPAGSVSIVGEPEIVNSEISIQIEGASFRTFGAGRVRPSDGSTTVMGEITIPFNFPQADGKNYGFVSMDNGDQTPFTGYLYLGNDFEAEPIETMIGEVTSDMKGLIFRPTIVPEPETEYTLVIPEGNVKAYEIGAAHNAYLKDYISERVELHYTTPSVASLPLWQPSAVNVSDGDELEHIDYFIVSSPDYEYEGTIYNTVFSKLDREGGKLYEVTADGEKEVASFYITRPTLTAESEIGNGQYIGKYFVGKVDKDLYAGKTYRLVLLSGEAIVDNPFIGQYIGNEEVSVLIKGAASTEMKSEFTNNIAEGQTASHIGVVSIYTNDPVAAVEGAVLELRNGEDVKTASIRVAAEEGYSHIYADFSDADHKALALDRATEYTVVLPQGSLTHAENENLVNNEYSFAVNGLEKEAEPVVPEYVSVDFTIDQYVSTSYRMVKGEPSIIKLNASDEWYLKSLTLNGEDVIDEVTSDGFYTLPALEADAELAAEFSYYEDLEMTEMSGVGTIDGSNGTISVYNNGGVIVIENLAAGDNVAVYTVNGMVIKSFVASKDVMYIDAPVGQVYIIRVNNAAVKLQH